MYICSTGSLHVESGIKILKNVYVTNVNVTIGGGALKLHE
jgi:hypothetical protein